jgi:hypothetical protein
MRIVSAIARCLISADTFIAALKTWSSLRAAGPMGWKLGPDIYFFQLTTHNGQLTLRYTPEISLNRLNVL